MRTAGTVFFLVGLLGAGAFFPADPVNLHYPVNREPLLRTRFVSLPLGAVKPRGWLRDQLVVAAEGLTGRLDEVWPDLMDSAWKGGAAEGWERGPYYLDGLVPLTYLLEDPRLIAKTKTWMEWILASGKPGGWFGPEKNKDRWPLSVALKVLAQYHEATGDTRALALIEGYFRYLRDNPPDWPDKEWRGVRAMENLVTAYWLHRRTGDPDILKVAASIQSSCFDWADYFVKFPFREKVSRFQHPNHVVNVAMAVKHPGVWYQQSGEAKFRNASFQGIANLDAYHGQVGGRFSGDELLAGRSPVQGTELCAVVEYMFSLENLIEVLGDVALADRLEMLAYNANPGASIPDYRAHQYDQQANQVLSTRAKRGWTNNDDTSNLYGLEPNFGCCTANMHQGWPKFVSHLWMATHDQGLAAVAYGPSKVTARVADGAEVTIVEETEYPFDGNIRLKLDLPREVDFPLHLRIPAWAEGARLSAAGSTLPCSPGAFTVIRRTWKPGDDVEVSLPMKVRAETRWRSAAAILRGPLVFALRIGEGFTKLKVHDEKHSIIDWEIRPTTPWNYGLLLDREAPERSFTVVKGPIGKLPFANEGAPVVLKARGKAIPSWKLEANSAAETPESPAASTEPAADIELIPYGCTRLRISEFPVIRGE